MIKPYIKNETAVEIICSICDRMYPGMDCEPADCEWMKMLAEESVDAAPVVRCKDCKHGELYARIDGETGVYCNCSNSIFQYANEHTFTPARDIDDFCSYGERKEGKDG